MSKSKKKPTKRVVQEAEIVQPKGVRKREFKPQAGFFFLYLIVFVCIVAVLGPKDYDSVLERAFWLLITVGIFWNLQRHWPAAHVLLSRLKRGQQ